jgi:chromosome segregation ATPase
VLPLNVVPQDKLKSTRAEIKECDKRLKASQARLDEAQGHLEQCRAQQDEAGVNYDK